MARLPPRLIGFLDSCRPATAHRTKQSVRRHACHDTVMKPCVIGDLLADYASASHLV